MGRWTAFGAAVALAALVAVPALADSKDSNKKKGPILRWAHTYDQAVAEAKERNCVIYVTIHAEH
jgi:hypothetical protein